MSSSLRSFGLGAVLAALGALILVAFAGPFASGATWSPVHQTGGPGFLFVVGPAIAGWFGVAGWVTRRGPAAVGEAIGLGGMAALAALGGGWLVARAWPEHPAVLESLFSTVGVALVVSAVASVAVRLGHEPQPE